MLAAYDRVVTNGMPELMLISGYSGIGKSSIVNELHKDLVPSRGLFASGKFDQYERNIPYATIVQAFQELIRGCLSKSDVELESWRDAFGEAVGANGRLVVELVPELGLIIGEQPPLPIFRRGTRAGCSGSALRRFIGAFARAGHPWRSSSTTCTGSMPRHSISSRI